MKDTTVWLDALKRNMEEKTTDAHRSATQASTRPTKVSSDALAWHTDKTDRNLVSHDEPPVRAALLRLFANDRAWQNFFRLCCEMSSYRLIAHAWQWRDELMDRGYPYPVEEVEDTLLGLARELLPESAAAGWDAEWAHALCKDALCRLAKDYAGLSAGEKIALDLSGQAVWDERMAAAGLDNEPAALRAALKGWEQAGLEAIERVRVKGGAA